MRRLWIAALSVLCSGLIFNGPPGAKGAGEAELWAALKSGRAFAMMRHALAPGTGDPANFDVNDCKTQRNLSDVGRDQARKIGARFRANGIASARVVSSAWCRCQETARLLGLGAVATLPSLNSFFETMGRRGAQTEELKTWLAKQPLSPPLVLVTHQVNISALARQFTSSGETVVIEPQADGGYKVLGSL